ncbi:metal ABC transporter ATP-binding protein [Halorubellus sp. JP-L1]|uniref:metal ABC transporter ATP-binding protein n=1 Tax=Halorubellus sp. JP-L1 TaxID=2715753 RepID=UPI001407CF1D|nr:metal ABC transporter ATP-binding protein [Halorubellus sp. JP-L1]NHN43356.1 metal ABC transporter ATP-binding protein [Halorubellus sp. JP-L1]
MTAIEARDVSFAYGDRPVVEDVSLDVASGEFLGLVGPNGSGKSTLLELLIGLRRPDSGSVALFGEPAVDFEDGEYIGYVPQDVASANGEMPVTVAEAVRMGRYPHKWFRRFDDEDRRAVDDAMARVGITDLAERRVGRLSGGQRQRVFIARALASNAELLALDEPTVGVDADSREAFYDLLHELNDDGLTVVLIEHDIGVVTTHASAVACLNRELFFHGDPDAFVETDALSQAYGDAQHVVHHDH